MAKVKIPVIRIESAAINGIAKNVDAELSSIGVSIYAVLESRRPKKGGLYPIRIRITHKRSYRDYGTKQNSSLDDFIKMTGKRPHGSIVDQKIKITALLERAFSIVLSLNSFNFPDFNKVYLNKQSNDLNNIFNWYDDKIKELETNGQISTALTYMYSRKSLQRFIKPDYKEGEEPKILRFDEITPLFLKDYERQSSNPTTVGIYLRPLKHIFNRAMDHPSNFIKNYPFKKYKIPSPRNIKKALTKNELKSIYEYEAQKDSPEAFYKDIWLFSYFANGINMKDICRLKYANIKGDNIEFRRAKTINSNKDTKPINIVLTDDLKRIIEDYGTKPRIKENYIFNFLQKGMSGEKEMAAIKQATKQTNKYIKRVANNLEIEAEVSTYTARHSFATALKNAGVAPSFIGESLGHQSLRTTEGYLGSFEDDQRKKNIEKLKDW